MKIQQQLISLFSVCRIAFRFTLCLPFIIGSFSWLSSSLAKMKKLFFCCHALILHISLVPRFSVSFFSHISKASMENFAVVVQEVAVVNLILPHRFSLIAESAEESLFCA